jgi:hypothetical protein
MFRTSVKRLRVLLELADDVLGDPADDATAHDIELHIAHPHRTPLRWQRDRRPGTVRPAPAHCLSPVRAGRAAAEVDSRVGR